MIDPLRGLTSFASLYEARAAPLLEREEKYGAFVALIIEVLQEADFVILQRLQQEYCIQTLEELVSLARVDAREGTTLLQGVGVPADMIQRLILALESNPAGRQLLSEMERCEQFSYSLGCERDLATPPSDAAVGAAAPGAAPLSASLPSPPPIGVESVNLIDGYMPEIRDQGETRETCVAFAGTACWEYHLRRLGQRVPDLSEQFLYWKIESSPGNKNLGSAFQVLQNTGECTAATWPYSKNVIANNPGQGPPPEAAVTEASRYRCTTVRQLPSPPSVGAIRAELQEGRPVAVAIPVYKSWYISGVNRLYGIINMPLPTDGGPGPIGHAIVLVGCADDSNYKGGGYFMVRNSWGLRWGMRCPFGAGYGNAPFAYIESLTWEACCIVD
jgi:hypothetical protein